MRPTKSPSSRLRPTLLAERAFTFGSNEAFQFGVPAAVFLLTRDISLGAVVFGIEWTVRLVTLYFGGPIVSRIGAVRIIQSAGWTRLLVALAFAVVFSFLPTGPWRALPIALCGIVCAGLFQIAFIANERVAAVLVDHGEEGATLQSRLGAIDQTALIGGPVLGGLMLVGGVGTLMWGFVGITLLAAITVNAALRSHSDLVPPVVTKGLLTASARSLGQVARDPLLMATAFGSIAVNFIAAAVLATVAAALSEWFGHDPRLASIVIAVGGLVAVGITLMLPAAFRTWGIRRCFLIGLSGSVLLGAVAPVAPSVVVFGLCVMLIFALDSVIALAARTVRITVLPREDYAQRMSSLVLLGFLPMPMAGMVIAAVSSSYGLRAGWLVIAGLAGVFATISLALWLREDGGAARLRTAAAATAPSVASTPPA